MRLIEVALLRKTSMPNVHLTSMLPPVLIKPTQDLQVLYTIPNQLQYHTNIMLIDVKPTPHVHYAYNKTNILKILSEKKKKNSNKEFAKHDRTCILGVIRYTVHMHGHIIMVQGPRDIPLALTLFHLDNDCFPST